MSNEIILCIWDELSSADVIYSFSNLNIRINSLLLEFHRLYKELDLRYCSLSACRFLCHQVSIMVEWHLGLTVLKLGNPIRCPQTDFFLNEITKSVVTNHFKKQGKPYENISEDTFRILIRFNKIQPIFPQLVYLYIYLKTSLNEDIIDVLLFVIAGGSSMRTCMINSPVNKTHNSRCFFDWLFRCSPNLVRYKLQSSHFEDAFEIRYEHTIVNSYISHNSLVYLKIDILNLNTLYVLIHYLPQLEHLDVDINSIIGQNNDNDQNFIKNWNYSTKIRVFIVRNIKIVGNNCIHFEQLIDKFNNTLEEFSLSLTHYCNGERDICFDGHRLTVLCKRLPNLRSIHFVIQLRFIEPPSKQILNEFIEDFRAPFWLNGPLGRIRVCVNYHQVFDHVQIFSLPYIFFNNSVYHTIDIIDTLFNINEKEQEIQNDLSISLKTLWCNMRCLIIFFVENQKIPISFLYALQCPSTRNKTLVISSIRGILPDNLDNHIQLIHFTILQLKYTSDTIINYDLQQIIGWIRLLPNIKSLFVSIDELNYWINNGRDNKCIDTFLKHLNALYIECSSIINKQLNEEMMITLLPSIVNKHYFSRLECLRFIQCRNISSSWSNINKWIDFIFTHINQHQLKYLRFTFIENEEEITDMKTGYQIITITDPPCIIDIHRHVSENRISFWIERKYR